MSNIETKWTYSVAFVDVGEYGGEGAATELLWCTCDSFLAHLSSNGEVTALLPRYSIAETHGAVVECVVGVGGKLVG